MTAPIPPLSNHPTPETLLPEDPGKAAVPATWSLQDRLLRLPLSKHHPRLADQTLRAKPGKCDLRKPRLHIWLQSIPCPHLQAGLCPGTNPCPRLRPPCPSCHTAAFTVSRSRPRPLRVRACPRCPPAQTPPWAETPLWKTRMAGSECWQRSVWAGLWGVARKAERRRETRGSHRHKRRRRPRTEGRRPEE